jgi:hypothetical protein
MLALIWFRILPYPEGDCVTAFGNAFFIMVILYALK